MPTKRVQLPDGNIGEFPDSMSNEQIEAVLRKQYPPQTPPQTEPTQKPAISRFLSSAKAPFVEGAKGAYHAVTDPPQGKVEQALSFQPGVLPAKRMFLDPQIEQAREAAHAARQGRYSEAVGHGVAASLPLVGPWVASVAEKAGGQAGERDYAGAAGTIAGNAAIAAAPKVLGKGVEIIKKTPEGVRSLYGAGKTGMVDSATKTAEQAHADAESVEAHNKAATDKTLLERGKVDQKNVGQVLKDAEARKKVKAANREAEKVHAAKTAETQAGNKAAVREQGKIQPTNAKLNEATSEMRARVETARQKALKVGNEKYTTVNAALDEVPASRDFANHALLEASEKLKSSKADPTILKDMEKALEKGEQFTYRDLQGDYSRLGKELTTGKLDGDVFAAYDTLHEALGEEMQRIANSKGLGEKLQDARNYWRRMKQTFGKPLRMTDNATDAVRSANPEFLNKDEYANQLRLLGSFDPEITRVAGHIENLKQGVESLPKEKPMREILKPNPAKPAPAPLPKPTPPVPYGEPEPTRPVETPEVSPRSVREANVAKKMESWKTLNKYQIAHLASGAVGMVLEALTGKLGYEGLTGVYTTAPLTPILLAKIAEMPGVREWLTRPQPGDLELLQKIPNADRVKIVDALKGAAENAKPPIKVAPAVAAALGMQQSRKRVGDILPKSTTGKSDFGFRMPYEPTSPEDDGR